MSKLFSCDYFTIRWNVAREERKEGIKKKIMDFDYYEEYLTSISSKKLLFLKKWNFHSFDICIEWWKINYEKKDKGEKLI